MIVGAIGVHGLVAGDDHVAWAFPPAGTGSVSLPFTWVVTQRPDACQKESFCRFRPEDKIGPRT
jgi:hypothetical protein